MVLIAWLISVGIGVYCYRTGTAVHAPFFLATLVFLAFGWLVDRILIHKGYMEDEPN